MRKHRNTRITRYEGAKEKRRKSAKKKGLQKNLKRHIASIEKVDGVWEIRVNDTRNTLIRNTKKADAVRDLATIKGYKVI